MATVHDPDESRPAACFPTEWGGEWKGRHIKAEAEGDLCPGFSLALNVGGIGKGSDMPNLAAVLRDEVTRLARKEARSQTESLKKASAQYRRDIAALKRQVAKLERQVSLLEGLVLKKPQVPPISDGAARVRFTARGLRLQRQRLGLSAASYAQLVGVSPQSIYNWEQGITRPRKEQVAALVALRGIGKREAQARLRQLAKRKPGGKKSS